MKKIMLLVPHQDDDIALCGSILKDFVENEYRVFAVFMTNGDYDERIGFVRLREALDVMKLYGIPETQVIFMGYANRYEPECPHIYNAEPDEILKSRFGNSKTYGLPEHPEYCYQRTGVHNLYQRKNLISDLRNIIAEIMPDIIMATDAEMHVDHIANSLFLDEAMGALLKQMPDYRPVIYKKQGYATEWYAEADYRPANNEASKNGHAYSGVNGETAPFLNPYLQWEDRIRLPIHISARSVRKEDNIVYQALQMYSSQNAAENFDRILNSDSVFFWRRTDSVTYRASVSATSGEASYINDFKIVDCGRIRHADKWKIDASIWHPALGDDSPIIMFDLERDTEIAGITIYQEFSPKSEILCSALIFDGADRMEIGRLETRKATYVGFAARVATKVEYAIEKCSGSMEDIGISEIEIYGDYSPELARIKIMIDDNFIYDYIVDESLHGKIGIYQLFQDGSAHAALDLEEYEISLMDGRGVKKEQYVHDYSLFGIMKEEKLILKAYAKSNKDIYDEVALIKRKGGDSDDAYTYSIGD